MQSSTTSYTPGFGRTVFGVVVGKTPRHLVFQFSVSLSSPLPADGDPSFSALPEMDGTRKVHEERSLFTCVS